MRALPPRFDVLGVRVSAIDLPTARAYVREALDEGQRGYVCFAGVHGVIDAQDDPDLLQAYNNSFLTTPDGMPLVWLGRRRAPVRVDRVYGPDLLLAACEDTVTTGKRHFFLGGAPGVAEELARRLQAQFPGLAVAGTYSPPFRPLDAREEGALARRLNESQADVIWVGLGSPRQERFIAQWRDRLDATLLLAVGAAFDFHSGRKPQAPRWMQRSGLEWLFRLATEPRRLGPRYLRANPRFLWLLARESLRRRGDCPRAV